MIIHEHVVAGFVLDVGGSSSGGAIAGVLVTEGLHTGRHSIQRVGRT